MPRLILNYSAPTRHAHHPQKWDGWLRFSLWSTFTGFTALFLTSGYPFIRYRGQLNNAFEGYFILYFLWTHLLAAIAGGFLIAAIVIHLRQRTSPTKKAWCAWGGLFVVSATISAFPHLT